MPSKPTSDASRAAKAAPRCACSYSRPCAQLRNNECTEGKPRTTGNITMRKAPWAYTNAIKMTNPACRIEFAGFGPRRANGCPHHVRQAMQEQESRPRSEPTFFSTLHMRRHLKHCNSRQPLGMRLRNTPLAKVVKYDYHHV
jgi:hypothetical protein